MEPSIETRRYEPLDQCSIDLLRVLLSLHTLPCHDLGALKCITNEAVAIIIFAVIECGSLLPFESQNFSDILDQIFYIQQILEATVHQIDSKITPLPIDLPSIFGSMNFVSTLHNKSMHFACAGPISRAKSAIAKSVLAFMDEWTDILYGVDALQPLPCLSKVELQNPIRERMLRATLGGLNILPAAMMKKIALGIPEFVALDSESSPQLHWHPDVDARLFSLEISKRDRAAIWPVVLGLQEMPVGKVDRLISSPHPGRCKSNWWR